ncbi:hypothetical protein G5C51_25715 [Streptomyces sp. A7024]|uniref:GtrA/DPMS transmembrane domain-containing protein n=1 Tax=Streptomyces coryli TaxID=1128680 RepID=A0A6G4U6C8_9ACTN|nr:GtrA family protein [Streptomyces coryli]NGN67290.1 hypothetical protein [Streptomyces coryli]
MRSTKGIRRHAAAFARFVGLGGGVTLTASAALVALSQWLPFMAANAITTVASTVVATELHARITFRAGSPGLREHLQSAATIAAGWLVTSGAVAALHATRPDAGIALEQAVYLSATALVGLGRYVILRLAVFTEKKPAAQPQVVVHARQGGTSRRDSYRPVA